MYCITRPDCAVCNERFKDRLPENLSVSLRAYSRTLSSLCVSTLIGRPIIAVEEQLLDQAMQAIRQQHNLITSSSPTGFSGVKTEHLSQVKAMDWALAETKLHRIKVILDELERLKAEADAAIATATDAAAKKEVATQHKLGLTDAQARLREVIVEELDDCATRCRISAVTRLERGPIGVSNPSSAST